MIWVRRWPVRRPRGGFLVRLGMGREGRGSAGPVLTRAGAGLIAAALTVLTIGLITR